MKTIDACGISCPEPILRLKSALETLETGKELILLVDNKAALNNCSEYAQRQGLHVEAEKSDDIYSIKISK